MDKKEHVLKWIDVNVVPPPIQNRVLIRLIVDEEVEVDLGVLYADWCWTTFNDWGEEYEFEITHWMPLPDAEII